MLDTFKVRLKAKSTAAGANLSQVRIDALADRLNKRFPDISEEAEHDAILDDLYPADSYKELAALDDHNRAKAAKEKKDKAGQKDDKSDEADKQKPPAEMPDWFKPFADELTTLRKEKTEASIADKVKAHEKLKGVSPLFLKGRKQPDKAEDIDAWADEVSADWEEFTKENPIQPTDKGQTKKTYTPGRSNGSASNGEASKDDIKAVTKLL